MKFLILFIIIIMFSGCVRTEKINDNIIQVKGYGVDTTFYPVLSFRIGIYEYFIINNN